MGLSRKTIILGVIATFVLSGCASVEPTGDSTANASKSTVAIQEQVELSPTPDLSNQERFRLVLEQLERGESQQAAIELQAYLANLPNSDTAKGLLRQIETPVSDYFPADSFGVTLESGESLSTLARDYLGDVLQFYALAKYNNILVPRDIHIGQTINLPATKAALAEQARLLSLDTDNIKPSRDVESGDPAEATVLSEVLPEVQEREPSPLDGVKNAFAAAQDSGNYDQVVALAIQHNEALLADNWQLLRDVYVLGGDASASVDRNVAATRYDHAAQILANHDSADAALTLYEKALDLAPEDEAIRNKFTDFTHSLAETYHKQAATALRAQELEKAIHLWDRVLELDPEHSNALVYRAQAIELQERLSDLQN